MNLNDTFSELNITLLRAKREWEDDGKDHVSEQNEKLGKQLFDSKGHALNKSKLVKPTPEDGSRLIPSIVVEICRGCSIDDAAQASIAASKTWDSAPVIFNFNGVTLTVVANDQIQDVIARYEKGWEENAAKQALQENAAQQELQAKTDKGWEIINSLTYRDDDQVMKAISLMAYGYDDCRVTHPVPFAKIGEKLSELGYLPIDQIPQNIRALANDKNGISEEHKSALASCIAGNYMKSSHSMVAAVTSHYLERFGGNERPTNKEAVKALPNNGPV